MKFDKNMEKLILGNLTQRKIGYGIVQPGNNIYSGVHVIKVYNIMAGLTKLSDLDLTATEIEEKYSRTRLKGGELIVSIVGTIGKTAIVPKEFAGCNIVRAIALIDIKEEFLSLWTKYYIDSPKGQEYIKGNLNTTVQPTLNIKSLSNMPIPFYGTVYTKKAVNILSTIDNKIQLNKQINENLEQQAQALFKSWFVDFEPFKDGKFVDSELERIPEGWKVGTFKDIIHSTLSGDWGKECKQGNHIQKVFCIRGADIPNIKRGDKGNMPTRFIIEKNFQSKALMDGDMVIEVSGGSPTQATGRACRISCGLLDKYNHSIVCTNFCRAIKPLSQYSSFLYYMWEMFYNQGIMFSYENGTTGIKNLDINRLIQKEPIIIPPVEIALEFEKITQIYYEKIQSNGVESEKLSQLRDTLLPRLMSGELAITDVDDRSIFQ